MTKRKSVPWCRWFYVIKIRSKFLPDFYSLDNVDLQNKNVIELMEWVVYEAV